MTTAITKPDETSNAPRRFRLIMVAPALAVIALLCWAIASPVGASPDDDFHLASIWCGAGDRPGLCQSTDDPAVRKVPAEVYYASECFRHQPTVSAACTANLHGHKPTDMIPTSRGSFQANYPPVYYAVMSLLASPNVPVSVLLMRLLNVLIFVGIAWALYALLPRGLRSTLLWMWIVTMVPLGMFLVASNNPSSWAILAGGSVWLALLGYFRTHGRRKVLLGILFAVTTVMAAGARGDAAVYSVLAIGAVVFLTARRTQSYWLSAILPAALVLVAVVFYFSSQQASVSVSGLSDGSTVPEHQLSAASLLISNLANVPSLWMGVFGTWSLGWFDTDLPAAVAFAALASAVAITFAGLRSQSVRKTVVVVGLAAVLWLLPVYILQQSHDLVGVNVQPRYLLPLIVLFVGLALLRVDRHRLRFSSVQLALVVVALGVAQALALQTNLRRYVTGVGHGGWNLDAGIRWWWSVAPSPMTVLIIGSLSFVALLVVLIREMTPRHGIHA